VCIIIIIIIIIIIFFIITIIILFCLLSELLILRYGILAIHADFTRRGFEDFINTVCEDCADSLLL